MTASTQSILQRKLAPPGRRPDPGAETAARIFRVGLARAARELAGLPFAPDDIRDERRSQAEVLDALPERALYAVLEGPGQALGLLCLSGDLVCALVEAQTLGAPLSTPPPPRRLTRTDAALCAAVIDGALHFLEAGLAGAPDLAWAGGFRYASFIDELRPLALLLEDQPYRSLQLSGTLTGTSRSGLALLCLPAEGRAPAPALPEAPPADDPLWRAALARNLGAAEIGLHAVLARVCLPIGTSLELKAGSLLRIGPGDPLNLTLATPEGVDIHPVRLGRQGSQRAVRLTTPPSAAPAPLAALDTEDAAPPPQPLRQTG